jgi:hypothetical protein
MAAVKGAAQRQQRGTGAPNRATQRSQSGWEGQALQTWHWLGNARQAHDLGHNRENMKSIYCVRSNPQLANAD